MSGQTKAAMSEVHPSVSAELQVRTKDIHPRREMRISVSNSRPGKFLTGGSIVGHCRTVGGWGRKQDGEELDNAMEICACHYD